MDKQIKDKRTAIMDAALKLFTERGFHGTTTAQISKDAGVATGTLFNYFPTKEELINSLYFEVKGRLSSCIKKGIDPEASFETKMRKLWSNTIQCGVSNPEEFHFIGQFGSSPYITKITREEAMKEYEFIRALVEEGFSNGRNKDYSMELAMMIFYHSSGAVVNLIINSGRLDDMNEIIEEGFQLLWRGLSPE
ncbi:TetR/AcrR family transcriptional regulator [Methanococcoides methylutens]|uniref:Transcriptional regulator, TetR family n=1 Tax=Methanococcoides methylutens MM1 TaxID=1434104 RepID=A0A0E3X0F5_METMT|nr:TetR/AcrR family transcriptional regulator [Methanococcoides methylutens]AKB85254.1 Transcriptional regulator, TetR family [Methanococcoides methylutens MM1]